MTPARINKRSRSFWRLESFGLSKGMSEGACNWPEQRHDTWALPGEQLRPRAFSLAKNRCHQKSKRSAEGKLGPEVQGPELPARPRLFACEAYSRFWEGRQIWQRILDVGRPAETERRVSSGLKQRSKCRFCAANGSVPNGSFWVLGPLRFQAAKWDRSVSTRRPNGFFEC